MGKSFSGQIHKLITAIDKGHGIKLVYSTKQFYGNDGRKRNYYTLSEATFDPEKNKYVNMTVFSAGSTIQCVLFLRDFYYYLEGKEIPHDNQMWEDIKARKGVEF